MKFTLKKGKSYVLVHLEGKLNDEQEREKFMTEIDALIEEGQTKFIIDLGKVSFIDSRGLNIFLQILTRSRNAGGDTLLINLPQQLSKLMVITKLNHIFSIPPNLEQATEELKTI